MTDARVTQAGVLTLDGGTPAARVTQAGVLTLDGGAPAARVTQAGVLMLEGGRAVGAQLTQAGILVLEDQSPLAEAAQLTQGGVLALVGGTAAGARITQAGILVALAPSPGARITQSGILVMLDQVAVTSPLTGLALGRDAIQYLIEIAAFLSAGAIQGQGIAGLAEIPLATNERGNIGDQPGPALLYADRDWAGAPDDSLKPNVFYPGRSPSPLVFERLLPLYPEEPRRVQRQFGLIELLAGDAALDALVAAQAIDGRDVRVLVGPYMGAYSEFVAVANVVGTEWEPGDTVVRLGLRDKSYGLELPVQGGVYTGTGGVNGTAELKDKPRPKTLGFAREVLALLIDPVKLVYQVHDGPMQAVVAVYDRGAALTAGADTPDYPSLIAAEVADGNFATSLAYGLVRLGSSPAGRITADVEGDASGGYSTALDVLAIRLLTYAGIPETEIHDPSWSALASLSGPMGLYISEGERPTTAQVIDRLVASAGGFWGVRRDGKFVAGRLQAPEDATPALELDLWNVVDVAAEPDPPPRWRQVVSYQPIYTLQPGTDLALIVDAERRQYLALPWRQQAVADGLVRVRHLNAEDGELLTQLEEAEDALALAQAMIDLYGPERVILRATVKRIGFLAELGMVVKLTWPRFGLAAGRNFAVIGIREEADRDRIVLRLWGPAS